MGKSAQSGSVEIGTFRSPRAFVRADLVRPGMVLTMLGTTDELSVAVAKLQYRPWAPASYVSHAGMFIKQVGEGHWTFFESDDAGTGTSLAPTWLTFEGGGQQRWIVFPDAADAHLFEHPRFARRLDEDSARATAALSGLADEFHEVYSHYERLAGAAGVYGPLVRRTLARKQAERDAREGVLSPGADEGVFCSEAVAVLLEAVDCPAFGEGVLASSVGPGDFATSALVEVTDAVRIETPERMKFTPERWMECEKLRRAEREGGVALLNKMFRANEVMSRRLEAMEARARENSKALTRFREAVFQLRMKFGG